MKRFMRNWGYKLRWMLLPDRKNIISSCYDYFNCIGIIATFCTFEIAIFQTYYFSNFIKNYIGVYVWISLFIACLCKNHNPLSYEFKVNDTDIKICLRVEDILDSNSAIVIPTCSTFDTLTEDEFISKGSIQGQFQSRILKNDIQTLNLAIKKDLDKNGYKYIIDKDKSTGKRERYSIGAVSKFTHGNKHYYFLAIADVNSCGKVINGKFDNITLALEGFWNYMSMYGHTENIAIPLIGTGKAGIQGITREQVIKTEIVSFLAFNQDKKVTERLEIYIHPEDLIKKDIDLKEISIFLCYKCKYSTKNNNEKPVGHPLS